MLIGGWKGWGGGTFLDSPGPGWGWDKPIFAKICTQIK